jgi:hypothetical protein
MGKYQVAKTFRDGDMWYTQGQLADFDKGADELLAARVIVPLVEVPAKKTIETADKKLDGAENAVKNQKQKGQ